MKKLLLVLPMLLGLYFTVNACSTQNPSAEQSEEDDNGWSSPSDLHGKTLIVYYSFTNNSHLLATELQKQTQADILRVEPSDPDVDYNDYSIGLPMMNQIKNHPDEASSYPDIKTTKGNLADYDVILIVAPLWWNHMAAPLQTFLFKYGADMAEKNIGLVVSSGESSIEGVEADVQRLIPNGKYLAPSLWILRSRTNQRAALISEWLKTLHGSE